MTNLSFISTVTGQFDKIWRIVCEFSKIYKYKKQSTPETK